MDINRYSPTYKINKIHLTKLADYTTEEIFEFMYAIKSMKDKFIAHEKTKILNDTTVALLFNDTSLRTRAALEIGVKQLGGECVDLPYSKADMLAGENMQDILNVISRYGVGAVVTRGISQEDLDEFVKLSTIPVINSTNEKYVPMQVLCDLFSIWEKKRKLEGLKIAYIGKGTNVAISLIMGAIKCGLEVAVASPEDFSIPQPYVERAQQYGGITITENPIEAVKDADIVYTDSYHYHTITSEEEKSALKLYKVTPALMRFAKKDCLFMHPLPAKRDLEVSPEVINGKNSIVYDQAENRLHTVKAVLALLIKD